MNFTVETKTSIITALHVNMEMTHLFNAFQQGRDPYTGEAENADTCESLAYQYTKGAVCD